MAHYRKIDCRIWNDEKFRSLSDYAKLAYIFVLTHPHLTALGAMRGTIDGLARELGWAPQAFREAFNEAFAKGMLKADETASFIRVTNFLKYNRPESPNVVKAWGEALDLLPECNLKRQLIHYVKAFAESLTEGFAKALPEVFAKGMPYQDQDQEQEQEQEEEAAPSPASPAPAPTPPQVGTPIAQFGFRVDGKPDTWWLTQEQLAEWEALYPSLDILGECRKALAWTRAKPANRKTYGGMPAFLVNWFNREQNRGSPAPPPRPSSGGSPYRPLAPLPPGVPRPPT